MKFGFFSHTKHRLYILWAKGISICLDGLALNINQILSYTQWHHKQKDSELKINSLFLQKRGRDLCDSCGKKLEK